MTEAQRRGLARVAAVAVITVAAVYLLQLAGLALANRQARQVEARQRADVAALATQVVAIETAAVHANADEQVERWAREQRNWARSGDQVLAPVSVTAAPTPAGSAPAPAPSYLERLWRWLRSR